MRRTVISALLFLTCLGTGAANSYNYGQHTIGDGLGSQSLTCLAKDCYGRLWIGSNVGFSIISNGNVTNISDIVCEGGHTTVGKVAGMVCNESALIASDGRILHYDLQADTASILRYGDRILYAEDFLLKSNTATFFDNVSQTVYSYDMISGICTPVSKLPSGTEVDFRKIASYEKDSLNIYLADDRQGIYQFNRSSGQLRHIPGSEGINARTMTIDKSGTIWVASDFNCVDGYYIQGNFERIASYSSGNCDIPDKRITVICSLPDGNLLIGHDNAGINVIERNSIRKGGIRVQHYDGVHDVTAVMCNPARREILFSTENHGLMSVSRSFIGQIQHMHESNLGIVSYENYLYALEEPEGTVLLGTSEYGIKRINLTDYSETEIPGTSDLKTLYMCNFDKDRILVQDLSSGLVLLNRKNGRTEPFDSHPIADLFASSDSKNIKLLKTPEGDYFIFNADARHYLFRSKEEKLFELDLSAGGGLKNGMVSGAASTPFATYATIGGNIIEINCNTGQTRLIYKKNDDKKHIISSLASTSVGDLYFTDQDGLHRYDPRSNTEKLVVPATGIGCFFNAVADSKDRIWFSTNTEYVQMYNAACNELLIYSAEDGVTDSKFLNTWVLSTGSGIILQPNVNGILSIDTDGDLMTATAPEKIICMKAVADGKAIPDDILAKATDRPFSLHPKYKELNIEISANAFNPSYPHVFLFNLYRNSELVMSRNTISTVQNLPKLESGTYRLEVQQVYRKGLSDAQTVMCFKVAKPFANTIPGVLVICFALGLFGYAIALISSKFEKNKMGKAMAEQDIKNREDKIAFLSNIAHELRTPLSLIYNPVKDFLQEKSVDGIDYERMERIFNQVNKMTVMVNMILDSSRADVNKADILVEDVKLNDWLNFLLEDYRIDCYGKGFSLKFIMDKSIGTVSIDKRIIETGLSNMVNNAIKYSTTGTTITVSTMKMGDMIRVSVMDQGQGFKCNPDDLFKRYYRENENSTIPGYGLGLPYAKLQLSLIGGNMSAMNNLDGVGSTFFMEFPSVVGKNGAPVRQNDGKAESGTLAQTGSEPTKTEEGMAQDFDTRNMTLLFVSANEKEQEAISAEYQDLFRLVLTAGNAQDAIGMMKRMNIDIAVSDIEIPDSDGFELCRKIKNDIEISHLPVILLTTRTDPRNRNMGYKMGADAFLARPFDRQQLYNLIRSQLGGRFEIKRQYTFGFFSMMSPDQTFSLTDEQFISRINEVISANISDVQFNEDTIHDRIGIQRTVMLKKMEGLLGTNIAGYIRRIKIGVVLEKLESTDDSLESLAVQTGFENVDSMAKSFRKETGKDIHSVRQTQ